MEFDTGPDVEQGHDISITTSSGPEDLGDATYDSDHDGIADSVIVIDGDHEYVVTDSDHDGRADAMHAYDSTGREVNPDTGDPIGAPGSDDASTGHGSGADEHTGSTTHTGGPVGDSPGADSSGADSPSSSDIIVVGDDGSEHSLGAPTIDLDKDGSPDTAVVHNADGSVTGYTDRDGDGNADQITQIGSDGKVVIAVTDGHGGWEVAATGHLDSSGALVEDTTTSAAPSSSGSAVPTPAGTPISGPAPAGDITFTDDGKDYDLGRPSTDLDGDGTPETVVTHLDDGTVVGYSDTDGDGTADQVTRISPDGQVMIGASDGHGGWHQAAVGHIGSDGKFVPDPASATAPG